MYVMSVSARASDSCSYFSRGIVMRGVVVVVVVGGTDLGKR